MGNSKYIKIKEKCAVKMLFSICILARNEENTLPKLLKSLDKYKKAGGDIVILDTGSTDNTVKIAKDWGANVIEVNDKFLIKLNKELSDKINNKFRVGDEMDIVNENDTLFDFASARNYADQFAKYDMIAVSDCDEVFTILDYETINKEIEKGAEQFSYPYVYAHDENGKDLIRFNRTVFYNKIKQRWKCAVHEITIGQAKLVQLDEKVLRQDHWQNSQTNRQKYLAGLAYDCYINPDYDRNSHYFGRELYYQHRPKSSIKELKRHIKFNGWIQEKAQSMLFIGDNYGILQDEEKQIDWYNNAFATDSSRRESLLRLAHYYWIKNDYQRVACYCAAALQINKGYFYSNLETNYTNYPHELLYWALWYLGRKSEAKKHWLMALAYKPYNKKYLEDAQFFNDIN